MQYNMLFTVVYLKMLLCCMEVNKKPKSRFWRKMFLLSLSLPNLVFSPLRCRDVYLNILSCWGYM